MRLLLAGRVVRFEPQRFLVLRLGLVVPAQLRQRVAQIVVRLGKLRPQPHHRGVVFRRLRPAMQGKQGIAQVEVRRDGLGIKPGRRGKVPNGLVGPAQAAERATEGGFRLG